MNITTLLKTGCIAAASMLVFGLVGAGAQASPRAGSLGSHFEVGGRGDVVSPDTSCNRTTARLPATGNNLIGVPVLISEYSF